MHQLSRFPLEGNHAIIDCASCHKSSTNLKFEPLGVACVDCHKKDYQGTTSPNHQQLGYSTNCTDCHNVKSTAWATTNFDHSSFPLTGGHNISCLQCHIGGNFQKISTECKSCHQTNYNSTLVPNHLKAGISTDCKTCHTIVDYKTSTFNHSTTNFPLTGAHAAIVQCSSCHLGNTTSAKLECISCHQTQYNGAKGHVASKFPTDCRICHNLNNWTGSTFNHSSTNFPLTGAHTTVECASCHTTGYAGTSVECKSCHQAKYNTAQSPNHTTAGISVDCKTCHTTTAWQPSSFKHTSTGFDLTGAHAAIAQCSSCHVGNTTSAKPECISCHQAQYNTAKGHVASKFPTDCTLCHNNNNWLGATFNHSSTNFPLTGAHTTVDCASCHTAGYAGTSMECKSCHQTDYNTAANPNHKTLGLSVTCTDCHTTNPGWQPASFPIHSTYYALTGAHLTIANNCAACHKGNYAPIPNTCYSCHATDYNNTKNPVHTTSGFSTDCAS
jgi:nitrate/TMAO reductase-like tetraheme cytochrome c subunit